MKISGFTFMRNTSKLYYPFVESILSVLPLVDEFVVALAPGDPDDDTEEQLRSIRSEKLKIIHSVWDLQAYPKGTVYAQQTDLAKQACSGDWLLYLQSDELIHEKYLPVIRQACSEFKEDLKTEGFLFRYKHFWGDYDHYVQSHAWYPAEIRIIRNHPDIHSFGDAQSFLYIPGFQGRDYRDKTNSRKLRVRMLDAEVYHYGWVRPPAMMQQKTVVMDGAYHDAEEVKRRHARRAQQFDYGNMNHYSVFEDSHPKVMNDFMSRFNWRDQLHYEKHYQPERPPLKHEKTKYIILSAVERHLLCGRQLFGYRNWEII